MSRRLKKAMTGAGIVKLAAERKKTSHAVGIASGSKH
jgi:hypothetical protein